MKTVMSALLIMVAVSFAAPVFFPTEAGASGANRHNGGYAKKYISQRHDMRKRRSQNRRVYQRRALRHRIRRQTAYIKYRRYHKTRQNSQLFYRNTTSPFERRWMRRRGIATNRYLGHGYNHQRRIRYNRFNVSASSATPAYSTPGRYNKNTSYSRYPSRGNAFKNTGYWHWHRGNANSYRRETTYKTRGHKHRHRVEYKRRMSIN